MSQAIRIPLSAHPPADPLGSALARIEHGDGRAVLTRDGAPVAAVVPLADLRALEELDAAEDEWLSREADAAQARWEADGRPPAISHEDLCRELGIDPSAEPDAENDLAD